jgi:Patatin-like phospholipase
MAGPQPIDDPVKFSEVLWKELQHLGKVPANEPVPASAKEIFQRMGRAPDDQASSALCLSGGGIRSATFNLGVIQAITRFGLLGKFDYLSSVSGGGYIAGWLRAWLHRESLPKVAAALSQPAAAATFDPLAPEPRQLDHLREYSNYLTPRVGLFSADTWAFVAITLRNLILNWLVLVPGIAVVVTFPQVALIVANGSPVDLVDWGYVALGLAMLSAVWASAAIHRFRRRRTSPASQGAILAGGIAPLWLSCLLLSIAGLWLKGGTYSITFYWLVSALWCLGVPTLGWVLARLTSGPQPHAPSDRSELAGLLLSGGVITVLFFELLRNLLGPLQHAPAIYVITAVPILLAVYLLARTLFVAFASWAADDDRVQPSEVSPSEWEHADREWWARLSGWILLIGLSWMGISTIVVLGGYFIGLTHQVLATHVLAGTGGLLGLITARLGAHPETTGNGKRPSPSPIKELLLSALAPLTLVVIIMLLAHLVSWAAHYTIPAYQNLLHVNANWEAEPLADMEQLVHAVGGFLIVPVVFIVLSWALGWVVNINRFSAHGQYRDRLTRAYLGASHLERKPDPFTGFDPSDNIRLHELTPDSAVRPFPVINTTLNLVKSAEHLAWQQRKAESFSMTPLFCGNFHDGYRPSRDYGGTNGVSLATAVTISGAAANPNAGYHSSPLVTFLMTLFNVRLGCWLGNTNKFGQHTYRDSGPRHAGGALFSELLGFTDAEHGYVNLSDGGHFDNLGIYEMVLRRCRFILASDVDQDPGHDFEDLGNVIRKVRIDFGVPITFEKKIRILPRGDQGEAGLVCALAQIHYGAVDPGAQPGWIVYIKPTLSVTPEAPYDVIAFSRSSSMFPHEPTSDQWFTEAQFESYRALGDSLASQLGGGLPFSDVPGFVGAVKKTLPVG